VASDRDNLTGLRILFGLLTPGLGGHSQTALALAKALRGRGHAVEFVVRDAADSGHPDAVGVTASLIREEGFRIKTITDPYSRPGRRSFQRQLHDIVRCTPYDALHWFELHAGVRDAALVAAAERRAFVWTVTSGGVPPAYFGLNRVVVYTEEVAADARRRSPRTTVHVLPARIELQSLDNAFIDCARREIRGWLGIADRELLIVRVARCSSVYLRSIHAGIELAQRLRQAGRPARFLHAGYVEDPGVAADIQCAVAQANAASGETLAWSVTNRLESGTRYAAAADVCIGSGRSAMEAIALGRPTLIAWGSRYLGLVDDHNVDTMAATNFQGRHSARVVVHEDVVDAMLHAVLNRLSDEEAAGRIHEACARVVRGRYSIERATEAYERLYADRTVAVDGFLRYYGNPRHLGRELFHRLPAGIRFSRPIDWLRRVRSWVGVSGTD
jgi:glycosyltransferase involved in cell wall biosynthesis